MLAEQQPTKVKANQNKFHLLQVLDDDNSPVQSPAPHQEPDLAHLTHVSPTPSPMAEGTSTQANPTSPLLRQVAVLAHGMECTADMTTRLMAAARAWHTRTGKLDANEFMDAHGDLTKQLFSEDPGESQTATPLTQVHHNPLYPGTAHKLLPCCFLVLFPYADPRIRPVGQQRVHAVLQ